MQATTSRDKGGEGVSQVDSQRAPTQDRPSTTPLDSLIIQRILPGRCCPIWGFRSPKPQTCFSLGFANFALMAWLAAYRAHAVVGATLSHSHVRAYGYAYLVVRYMWMYVYTTCIRIFQSIWWHVESGVPALGTEILKVDESTSICELKQLALCSARIALRRPSKSREDPVYGIPAPEPISPKALSV